MRSAGVLWSSLVVYLLGMFLAALSVHRNREGQAEIEEKILDTAPGKFNVHHRDNAAELPFQKMVGIPFIVFLIANLYFIFFFYWIMNVYDPELLQIHQEMTHQEMLDFHDGTEYLKEVRKNKLDDYTPTMGGLITQYFRGAIGGFIFSLLIAGIVRRI